MSIQFRRINGRIVPIDDRKGSKVEKNGVAKGVGFLGAGVVTGVGAGVAAAKVDLNAAHSWNNFRNKHFEYQVEKLYAGTTRKTEALKRLAAKARLDSVRSTKAAFKIKTGGAALGGGLVSIGTHKILSKTKLDDTSNAGISAASGIVANFAIRSAYTKHIGRVSTWSAVKHAAKRILIRGFKL